MDLKACIAATLAVAVLFGCAPLDEFNSDVGSLPQDYKRTIKLHVLQNFFDPYSIRNASISNPVLPRSGWYADGWLVCLEVNAKNRMGGYTGLSRTAYFLRLGQGVVRVVESEDGEYYCSDNRIVFSPWPELERLE